MIYGNRLKEKREEKELTQIDVADYLDIYKGLYNQYEREYVIIPIKHLNTLCNYFRISIDYVLNLTDMENYKKSKNSIDKTISGKRLKEFRKQNKLTQDKLAKLLNISRTTIAEYERGTNIIATPFLYTICSKFHVSADYLLGKTDENHLV